MIKLLAETPRNQKIIDNLQRSLDQFKKHMEDRMGGRIKEFIWDNKKLKEQLNEYRKRHPSTVSVKNGKAYAIMEQKSLESRS